LAHFCHLGVVCFLPWACIYTDKYTCPGEFRSVPCVTCLVPRETWVISFFLPLVFFLCTPPPHQSGTGEKEANPSVKPLIIYYSRQGYQVPCPPIFPLQCYSYPLLGVCIYTDKYIPPRRFFGFLIFFLNPGRLFGAPL
jgi:hypothetical protein